MESLSRLIDSILEQSISLEKLSKRKQLKIKEKIARQIWEWHSITK